jgi:hypothetical protein
MILLQGTGTAFSIASNAAVPFPTLGNPSITPANTKITMQSTGVVQIADTGVYQISIGVSPNQAAAARYGLVVNGSAILPVQLTIDFNQTIAASILVQSITGLLNVTTNPTTLALTNVSGAIRTLNNATGTAAGGPVAYMCIVKIHQ